MPRDPSGQTYKSLVLSRPMVRAVLAGEKTQVTELKRRSNTLFNGSQWTRWANNQVWDWDKAWLDEGPSPAGNPGPYLHVPWHAGDSAFRDTVHRVYPKIQPGTIYWVKEAFATQGKTTFYRTGHEEETSRGPRVDMLWQRAEAMPFERARILLRVTKVDMKRVQDFSEDDALAQGIENDAWDMAPVARDYTTRNSWFVAWPMGVNPPHTIVEAEDLFQRSFRSLIEQKHGPCWDQNPWAIVAHVERLNSASTT